MFREIRQNPILSVRNLKVHFPVRKGIFKTVASHVKAVDGISFDLHAGKTLGLVGESGCGKTTVAKALVKLVQACEGEVIWKGDSVNFDTDLLNAPSKKLRKLRKHIQMIFQDPFSSLDPRMTVGNIIGEAVKFHHPGSNMEKIILDYMEMTGLRREYFKRYPHEFSGGQRQRIGIARALATEPAIVIADEPVSALDVSVQAKVLNIMRDLQKRLDVSYLFITHDLSVVRHISHEIAVMYLGDIVEIFPTQKLKSGTKHPYTRALISSVPAVFPGQKRKEIILEGEIPSPMDAPPGCKFQTRCPYRTKPCESIRPMLKPVPDRDEINSDNRGQNHGARIYTHRVACHNLGRLPF
ncbi:MAG: ATP-binding cassette domain-containing protein [Desulfamplus sp.]|nr:ATP-binding cassette domain-containing protein [Desulfamplus sp.]